MGERHRRERGMVTAELAVASLVVAVLVVALAWAISALGLVLRCQGAAEEVARQLARGDSEAAARAEQAAPSGAEVATSRAGDVVTVIVSLDARPWATWLPGVPLQVTATALSEDEE